MSRQKQQEITLGDFEFQRDSEGYVESVSLGDQTWTGEAFRSLLHFPSSCFWMKADGTTKTDKAGAAAIPTTGLPSPLKVWDMDLESVSIRQTAGSGKERPGRIFFLVFIKMHSV